MGAEVVKDEGRDPMYFAEPSKPPYKPTYALLFYKACFVFKNKIMHVSISFVTPCHPKTIFKNYCVTYTTIYMRV